jgi:5-methylcytosine-specific restriction protein A
MNLLDIQPTTAERIMTLVHNAGVDVSDWPNFRGGEGRAASNPKYCYEWSFVQAGKVAVLNLWYKELVQENDIIFQNLNLRTRGDTYNTRDTRKRRAFKMDKDIQVAHQKNLPIRVVIGDGKMRDPADPNSKASRMTKRLLDPIEWHVKSYDWNTGDCILVRGSPLKKFADQFSTEEPKTKDVKKILSTSEVFVRSPEVRRNVLLRAGGCCEFCSEQGFKTSDGAIFLETHHVVPLSEGGPDTESNVVAICPNHHREAHYGATSDKIKIYLQSHLAKLLD